MEQISPFEKERLEKAQADAIGTRVALMWAMLAVGFCLVAFALTFGRWCAPLYGGWSPDKAREWAVGFRSIGFLLFGAGLTERVLIRFGK